MKKIIASLAAAGVLVAGAFVAITITGPEASAQTDEVEGFHRDAWRPYPGKALDEVLDDLVADDTLTEEQAGAVKDALADKWDEIKDEVGDRVKRNLRFRWLRTNIDEWLEDGVMTADELAELDVELPIHEDGPLAEALEDGQITQEEWDAFLEDRQDRRGEAPDIGER